ncbi:MAG: DNA adenine methylase [Candidatus Gracilibacteria bacterium]|jgi:hypothetical protein|nr:DNA adenine methylase [Candidatus Gracilibacteria bacterium]
MTHYPVRKIEIELSSDELMEDLVENHVRNRNNLRERALKVFLQEEPGTGVKEATSFYRYDVETLENGDVVYITRPVALNKGFDFVIHVSNHIFSNKKDYPKHDDIFNDIKQKIILVKDDLRDVLREDMYHMFEKIYYCVNIDSIKENFEVSDGSFNKLPGYSFEMLLSVIKWFFIEQDIRYWNWSGRQKFWEGLTEIIGKPIGYKS